MTTQRSIARLASIALFGCLGAQGIWGVFDQLSMSDTIGRTVQTAALAAYGSSGSSIAFRILLRKRRLLALEVVWTAGVLLATGLAPSAWGDAPLIAGIMSASAGAAIVALTLWLLHRSEPLPPDERQNQP